MKGQLQKLPRMSAHEFRHYALAPEKKKRGYCSGSSYHGRLGFVPCSRNATCLVNGFGFCATHNPHNRKKAALARQAKYDVERKRDDVYWAMKDQERKIIDLVKRSASNTRLATAVKTLIALETQLKALKNG